jgi:hypothetical protein
LDKPLVAKAVQLEKLMLQPVVVVVVNEAAVKDVVQPATLHTETDSAWVSV